MRKFAILLLLFISCATQKEVFPTEPSQLVPVSKIANPQTAAFALSAIQYYRFYLMTESKKIATEEQKNEFETVDRQFRENWTVGRELLDRWTITGDSSYVGRFGTEGPNPQFIAKYKELFDQVIELKKMKDSIYARSKS